MSIDLRLRRSNKTYRDGDVISGSVVVNHPQGDFSHNGIFLSLDGQVNLQLSSKNVGRFEAFYNTVKPHPLLEMTVELVKPGRMASGMTEIPFEVPFKTRLGHILHETYHGVFININYTIKADMKRNFTKKDMTKSMEFIVESTPTDVVLASPVDFEITPATLMKGAKNKGILPDLKITGRLDSADCSIALPFKGELTLHHCAAPIKSIELQLVRVETCGCAEGFAREATEIQNIQIGEGDVCRELPIPIYMIFPRLFTCPTISAEHFKIEFEINVAVIFANDHLVTKNFPIQLLRGQGD